MGHDSAQGCFDGLGVHSFMASRELFGIVLESREIVVDGEDDTFMCARVLTYDIHVCCVQTNLLTRISTS
jgi:hypothetical protein